jgi:hypothetical protein
MIAIIVNSKDKNLRKTLQSGVLIFHSSTKHPVAIGNTPFSKILLDDYRAGFRFCTLDKFNHKQDNVCADGSLDDFRKLAPVYYGYASMNVNVQDWNDDLSSHKIGLNESLSIASKDAFETVELVGT